MSELINLAQDIKSEVYPSNSEDLTTWHEQNPERLLISDGHVTFSISKGSKVGFSEIFNKL